MDRRGTLGTVYGLLALGLAASLIGFMTIILALAELPAAGEPLHRGAPAVVVPDPPPALPAPPGSTQIDGDERHRQGDARLFLRDMAAVAQRYPWAGPWRGETRTDLWINAPGSIGSTSPQAAAPVTPFNQE